jgi:hypothetical protein
MRRPAERAHPGELSRATSRQAKLLILEQMLPERFEPSRAAVQAAMADLHMLAITGGQERTAAEYGRLLGAAGFTLGAVTATAVAESLIEADLTPAPPRAAISARRTRTIISRSDSQSNSGSGPLGPSR